MGEVLNEISEKHLPFWGLPFFRESCDTGRMGARECLRSERTQSLLCPGGQGVRAHGMGSYSAQRVTELNNGLGVTVKRRREASPFDAYEVLPGGCGRERRNRIT